MRSDQGATPPEQQIESRRSPGLNVQPTLTAPRTRKRLPRSVHRHVATSDSSCQHSHRREESNGTGRCTSLESIDLFLTVSPALALQLIMKRRYDVQRTSTHKCKRTSTHKCKRTSTHKCKVAKARPNSTNQEIERSENNRVDVMTVDGGRTQLAQSVCNVRSPPTMCTWLMARRLAIFDVRTHRREAARPLCTGLREIPRRTNLHVHGSSKWRDRTREV